MVDKTNHLKSQHKTLEQYAKEFRRGDGKALLMALRLCCINSMPVPEPFSTTIVEGIDKWLDYEIATLDEALSVARPKGMRIEDRRKKKALQSKVFVTVWGAHQDGSSMDLELFENVGNLYGISAETARAYYYEMLPAINAALKELTENSK
jgi:hypothetical protein